jgi:hypothetical protein
MSASIRLVELVGDRDERPVDRQPGGVEVDVAPSQAEDLVAAHPGGGGQQEGG